MPETTPLRVADLAQNSTTAFDIRPATATLRDLAEQLGLPGLRKLRFVGIIAAQGARDWHLTAKLGATVTQACVATLEPVTTRIDTNVTRTYLAAWSEPTDEEVEMAGDDTIEPLGIHIDPNAVMIEALTLALPLYPRKEGANIGQAVFTEPGQTPMTDEDARPFSGLADLRNALNKEE